MCVCVCIYIQRERERGTEYKFRIFDRRLQFLATGLNAGKLQSKFCEKRNFKLQIIHFRLDEKSKQV